MARNWIVHGDATSSGGCMISSSPFTDVDGKGVCRKGDKATCPKHNGVFRIVGGYDPTTIIDGQEVAPHGAVLECGCRVLAVQQMRAFIDAGRSQEASNARSPSADGAPVTAAASIIDEAMTDASRDKSISQVYWSYGPDEVPISSSSRFFVDLNIHIETVNYLPGETVDVTVQGAGEQPSGAKLASLSLQTIVQSDGTAKILDVFRGKRVELYATR